MSLKGKVVAALTRRRPGPVRFLRSRTTTVQRAVATAALCAVAGATATVPMYAAFWWWDLLSHALAGGALAALFGLLVRSDGAVVAGVLVVAVGWEVVEPRLPTGSLPIWFATGDAPSDVAATLGGGLLVTALAAVGGDDER
jgi:peptidoglycan/LPS O-acetylase OafA/YrhL